MPHAPFGSIVFLTVIRVLGLGLLTLAGVFGPSVRATARVEELRSIGGLPAHVAGSFLSPAGLQQADDGRYFVFDRRGHAVYTVEADQAPHKIIEVGTEPGRVLDPGAFDIDPSDGTFVIADAPERHERVQMFTATGSRLGGFWIPERSVTRMTIDHAVLNGVGSLQYTGKAILLNQPASGGLVTQYGLDGSVTRTFGDLRPTGHEAERDLHLALNSGLPLADPTGGFFFVFQAGIPTFRKYDPQGRLVFERHIEGPEVDEYLRSMPTTWPTRRMENGDVLPLVPPAVRTARVDRRGELWISLTSPFTYVYDGSGDKVRTVQFRGAGVLAPTSLFFTKDGRVLVTPGCYAFRH